MGQEEYSDCPCGGSYTRWNIHICQICSQSHGHIEANKQTLVNIERDLAVAEDKLTEVATRLSAAEATWEMAENLYRQLADQVREHAYDIKDLSR